MKCKEGKEISQKSGKCVKICKTGSERNPISGRCKKVSTRPVRVPPIRPRSSIPKPVLKFCKDGFERSQKSGKCVKICKSGSERNPKTGRCKRVSKSTRIPRPSPIPEPSPISEPTPVSIPSPIPEPTPVSEPTPVPDNSCEITNDEIDGFFSKDVENCIQELFCTGKKKKFHEIFSDKRLPGESNCEALTRLIFPKSITKITKLLGKGVQGSVFEAIHSNGNKVAVKITIADTDDFTKELKIATKMEGLGVGVKLIGFSRNFIEDSGRTEHKFIMMEKIQGTLLDLVNERSFNDTATTEIYTE